MAKSVDPLKLNPKLVLHVGMIAIQWARVEFTLSRMMVGLLKSDAPVGLLLTSGMGFQTIQHFVACYVQTGHRHGPDFGEEILAVIEEADRLRIVRNSLVHNSWHPDDPSEHLLLVLRFKGKIRMYSEIWPDHLFQQVVEDMLGLLGALASLIRKYKLMESFEAWELRSPSPETLAPRQPADVPVRNPKTTEILFRLQSWTESISTSGAPARALRPPDEAQQLVGGHQSLARRIPDGRVALNEMPDGIRELPRAPFELNGLAAKLRNSSKEWSAKYVLQRKRPENEHSPTYPSQRGPNGAAGLQYERCRIDIDGRYRGRRWILDAPS